MPLHKLAITTPLATTAATSRVAGANLESILRSKVGLEKVQEAIMESTSPSQKPTLAEIDTALNALLA